ncbi:proton channel OTOP1-like [Megalops cyprinoides]|uniref:proton channel OTOP1-like n=1 Tax=Megalops cyprinoides TaxID=118141 RepID=UPI001863D3A9|nr:proton channel OTOP1-like [Megalops cyprinoides]
MEQDNGLGIMSMKRYRHSSSNSSNQEKDNKTLSKWRVGLLTQDYPKKNGEIISGQYGINLLLFGIALMLGVSYHGHSIKEKHLLSFITTIMLVQLVWMLWYIVRRARQKKAQGGRTEKDSHVGTSWLKGGLTILALLSLIMDAFKIGHYVGYRACVSAVLGVYPVVHVIHTISQVHFLWFHIKDVIKTFETFERFGVIHAVFTNLLLWCNGAMTESAHSLESHKKRLVALGFVNYTEDHHKPYCNCTTNACSVFSNSLYYLYPFNIEYHIIVSAMLFVMWKNIGRTIDHHHHAKEAPVARTAGLVVGPILGLVALASTIGVLVAYLIQVEDSLETRNSAISMFYYHGIGMLVSMCMASTVGLLIYRTYNLPLDSSKNPSRQLDKELLCGSSVGTWLMAWCSIVAAVAAHSSPSYRWPNLAYSLLLVLEKYVQNLFIIESLYRKEEEEEEGPATLSGVFTMTAASQAPPYDGIINRAFMNQDVDLEENGYLYCRQRSTEAPPSAAPRGPKKKSRRKQILRNIAVFLILCNSALWLLPAFGCRPQYDNGLEQETFGYVIWTMVLNFAMPLNLFYRMHCVASLFEVFQNV